MNDVNPYRSPQCPPDPNVGPQLAGLCAVVLLVFVFCIALPIFALCEMAQPPQFRILRWSDAAQLIAAWVCLAIVLPAFILFCIW